MDSKSNQISQVRIITKNGQTFNFWNISAITTTSDCPQLNKTIDSELDNDLDDNSVLVEQFSHVSELIENISQQCLHIVQHANKDSDIATDTLGLSKLTNTEHETLVGLITPLIEEVGDLHGFINKRRR